MKLLDLFSGIGGFTLGLKRAGFEFDEHYYSEIDKHAIAIYQHNFKGAEYLGGVENVIKELKERGIKPYKPKGA